MDHIDQAIYDTVHNSELSAKQIAPLMGVGHQVLINKANPQTETHKMSLREAVALQQPHPAALMTERGPVFPTRENKS